MYELKSEELKETDWNKYDISKALTLELNIVGNEGLTLELNIAHCWDMLIVDMSYLRSEAEYDENYSCVLPLMP